MSDKKQDKKENKNKKPKKSDRKIIGLDIDKAEYQEIILSNSAFPERDFYR